MFLDIPPELRSRRRWVNHDSKKLPLCSFNPARQASSTDPETWSEFLTALQTNQQLGLGLGFVFSPTDSLVGIDMDHVLSGGILNHGEDIIDTLNSYTEISPSGQGIHIICSGHLPAGRRKKDWLEMYDRDRYFTVTGNVWKDHKKLAHCNGELTAIHQKYLGSFQPANKHEAACYDLFHLPAGSRHDEILTRIRMMRQGGMSLEDILQLATVIADQNGMNDRLAEIERMVRWAAVTVKPEPKVQPVTSVTEYVYDTAEVEAWECPPVEWIIPGIIQRGSMILMAGESQTGKSMFASYLAHRMSIGADLFRLPVQKAKSLYICIEDKIATIQARLKEFKAETGATPDPGQFIMAFQYNFSLLGDSLQKLEALVTERKLDVLFIDTYQRATSGYNSFADEVHSKIFHSLSKITRKTRCTIVLIDHLRKSDGLSVSSNPSCPRRLTMDDVKGSGCKVQNADTVILMSRWENWLRVDVRSKDLQSDNVLNLEIGRHSPKYKMRVEPEEE